MDRSSIDRDRTLIAGLGGPTKVAEMLAFPRLGGPQRVQNWLQRGIPPGVKLKWPEIFLAPTARGQGDA